jgi:hypothetical protein
MVKLLISHSVSSSKNGSTDHGVMSLDRVIAAVQTAFRARFLSSESYRAFALIPQ